MTVHAFRRGVLPGPFSDSLIRCRPKTFSEIRHRVVAHIIAEEEVTKKHGSIDPIRPQGIGRPRPLRVHEATTEKKAPGKHPPYEARKPQTRARAKENASTRHNFQMGLKELIAIPKVADRLKSPPKTDKRLGPNKDTWCEFHQAFGHNLRNCLTLGFQLDELVRNGFLKEYLQEPQGAPTSAAQQQIRGTRCPSTERSTQSQEDSQEEGAPPPNVGNMPEE